MKNLKSILFVLFQVFYLTGLSQDNYIAGYIVQLNGDTIKGLINYKNWNINPSIISFRADSTSAISDFTPLDITGFTVLNEMYVGAIVDIETSPVLTAKLKPDPEMHFSRDTTFLQTIIDGSKSLFYLKDKTGKSHFYIHDSTFQLLIFKRYIKTIEGKRGVFENKTYIGQLINYLSDCHDIQPKIAKTGYDKTSLTDLFVYCYGINNSVPVKESGGSGLTYKKQKDKTKFKVGCLGGMTLTSAVFESDVIDNPTRAEFKPSLNFAGGVSLDIIIPRLRDRWSVAVEVTFNSYFLKGDYFDYESDERNTMYHNSLGFTYSNRNIMIRYTLPVKNHHYFVNAGYSMGRLISHKNLLIKDIRYYSLETTEIGRAVKSIKSSEHRLFFGTGARYKKLSFEFRYENGSGFTDIIGLDVSTNRYYFLLGYRIN